LFAPVFRYHTDSTSRIVLKGWKEKTDVNSTQVQITESAQVAERWLFLLIPGWDQRALLERGYDVTRMCFRANQANYLKTS